MVRERASSVEGRSDCEEAPECACRQRGRLRCVGLVIGSSQASTPQCNAEGWDACYWTNQDYNGASDKLAWFVPNPSTWFRIKAGPDNLARSMKNDFNNRKVKLAVNSDGSGSQMCVEGGQNRPGPFNPPRKYTKFAESGDNNC